MPRKSRKSSSLSPWIWLTGILITLIALLSNIQQPQFLITEALGEKANLVVHTDEMVQTIRPVWQGVSQGGEGEQAFFSQIPQQTGDIHLRLIRIDHVFDQYNLVTRGPNGLTYDFTQLDKTVDTILVIGAKPFFSLSYLPPALSSTGSVTDSPLKWNEWQQLVHRFIMHYSGQNERNLSNIYYEVWNEPDLFGNWKLTGDKNYLNLYRYAARAALQANPTQPFFIGGPATTGNYPNWNKSLHKLTIDEKLPLSFISWHRYSSNPDDFRRDFESTIEWRQQNNLPRLPLIISEWGFDSNLNPGYDTELSAAHMVSVISQTVGLAHEMLAFELIDGADPGGKQLWGRWGMLTSHTFGVIKKPRYRALQLLQGLGDQQIRVTGEGSWVKALITRTDRDIAGVIVNYDKRSRHWEEPPLTFTGLADVNYLVTIRRLNGLSEEKVIHPLDGLWQTRLVLQSNDVIRIQLTPQL